jgi:hypothetical protein
MSSNPVEVEAPERFTAVEDTIHVGLSAQEGPAARALWGANGAKTGGYRHRKLPYGTLPARTMNSFASPRVVVFPGASPAFPLTALPRPDWPRAQTAAPGTRLAPIGSRTSWWSRFVEEPLPPRTAPLAMCWKAKTPSRSTWKPRPAQS